MGSPLFGEERSESPTNSSVTSISSEGGTLSRTVSVSSILSDVEKISGPQPQEETNPEPPTPAPRPSVLGKKLHKSKGDDDSSINSPGSNEGEPTPVVTPARDAEIQKEQKQISVSATRVTKDNSRNFCTVGCTVAALACFAIAGFMSANKTPAIATSLVVAIGVLFAIGALAALCIPSPSSELSPTGLTHQAAKREGVN